MSVDLNHLTFFLDIFIYRYLNTLFAAELLEYGKEHKIQPCKYDNLCEIISKFTKRFSQIFID